MVATYCLPTTKGMVIPVAQERFGDWLRRTRESRGLSVRGLAEKAGITHPTISQIENHKTGATRDMVRKLAEGLGVPPSDVVRAWLEDENQEGGAITYITDRETAIVAEAYEGLPTSIKNYVKGQVLSAAALARELDKEETIGGVRSDEDENPTGQPND